MSSTLMWRPAVIVEGGSLPSSLKKTISRKLWDTDGSIGGGEVFVGPNDLEYIQGLRDAGIDGAKTLLDLIDIHGAVYLYHQH